jgi:hypothetical protein
MGGQEMISHRHADLLKTLNPVVECRIKVYNARDGVFFYDIDPKGYAFDKIKPLQDKLDSVMAKDQYMEKVAVGWMSTTRNKYDIELTIIKTLNGDSKVKKLHEVKLNEQGNAFDFEYHP